MDKFVLSWEDVEEACHEIADQFKNSNIDVIVPIIRGGLVPSVIISEILGVHAIIPIRISTRHTKGVAWYDKEQWQRLVNTNLNILVIDDIVDSGKTIDLILGVEAHKEQPSTVYLSSLVLNTNAKPKEFTLDKVAHLFKVAKDENENPWVIFPWDAR